MAEGGDNDGGATRRTVRTDFYRGDVDRQWFVVSGLSLAQIAANEQRRRLSVSQPSTTPPAEIKPGGARPTTPAPEPARPDADARRRVPSLRCRRRQPRKRATADQ